tara:strand:- start:1578 stop:1703 length:126 start_codon:yes stop_codon:yes gene_type:complete
MGIDFFLFWLDSERYRFNPLSLFFLLTEAFLDDFLGDLFLV